MQYVRIYINAEGLVEHTETSTHPLPPVPAIEVLEPEGLLPGMTDEEIRALPLRQRVFDHTSFDFESDDGRFKRAREIMDSLDINASDLRPSVKAKGRTRGELRNIVVKRATRGEQ